VSSLEETANPTVGLDSPLPPGRRATGLARRVGADRTWLLIVLIVALAAYLAIAYPQTFPRFPNFAAILLDSAQSGILTVGMMILLIGGAFDLSIGSILAFAGIVAGSMVKDWGLPAEVAIVGGLLTGTICGVINGVIITRFRINPLITTLATAGIIRGITQLVSPAGVANLPDSIKPFGQAVFVGLQSPFWVMLIVALLAWFAMRRVRFFRQFYFVGGNARAATLSGIKVDRVLLVGFVLMGLLAGLAGTLLASRLSNAVVLAGVGVELRVITAAVLGGASLAGGVGTIPGAILGVIFMSLVQNAMIIAGVQVFWQSIVVGIVLLVAIGIDMAARRGT
jgi:ribose/xylose/arabinose/galactoside ABC-type transport system permease subunit